MEDKSIYEKLKRDFKGLCAGEGKFDWFYGHYFYDEIRQLIKDINEEKFYLTPEQFKDVQQMVKFLCQVHFFQGDMSMVRDELNFFENYVVIGKRVIKCENIQLIKSLGDGECRFFFNDPTCRSPKQSVCDLKALHDKFKMTGKNNLVLAHNSIVNVALVENLFINGSIERGGFDLNIVFSDNSKQQINFNRYINAEICYHLIDDEVAKFKSEHMNIEI